MQRTVLFTDGVLQGFLQDRMRAAKMGVDSTGNARRESYAHPPVVRMTNTNILAGAERPRAIIRDTAAGIYVRGLGGGQVNPGDRRLRVRRARRATGSKHGRSRRPSAAPT